MSKWSKYALKLSYNKISNKASQTLLPLHPSFPFLQPLLSFGISPSFWGPCTAETKQTLSSWDLCQQAFHVLPVKLKLCEASCSWLLVSLLNAVIYSCCGLVPSNAALSFPVLSLTGEGK